MGRKLFVRVHLAAYGLQKVYDLTDRQVEYGLNDNAAYQLFSGKGIVAGWRPPDHTKIEEFRSRLSAENQRELANEIAKAADANLMTKLAGLGMKVIDYLKKKTRSLLHEGLAVDMKAVKAKARGYFFMPKNVDIEKRREVFKDLHRFIKRQMRPVVDIGHFTRTHMINAGKDIEFGRVFQLGRIKGNFLYVLASTSLRMEDKQSFAPMWASMPYSSAPAHSSRRAPTRDTGARKIRARSSGVGSEKTKCSLPSTSRVNMAYQASKLKSASATAVPA